MSKENKRSVYVDKHLWEEVDRQSGDISMSALITYLLKRYLDGKIPVEFNPKTQTKLP